METQTANEESRSNLTEVVSKTFAAAGAFAPWVGAVYAGYSSAKGYSAYNILGGLAGGAVGGQVAQVISCGLDPRSTESDLELAGCLTGAMTLLSVFPLCLGAILAEYL
jgi:hypothetical protein